MTCAPVCVTSENDGIRATFTLATLLEVPVVEQLSVMALTIRFRHRSDDGVMAVPAATTIQVPIEQPVPGSAQTQASFGYWLRAMFTQTDSATLSQAVQSTLDGPSELQRTPYAWGVVARSGLAAQVLG